MSIRIRFCTESDELDVAIAKGQYGYWATHCEALMPDGAALRYDDGMDGWQLSSEPDNWTHQVTVELPATKKQMRKYYRFLGYQLGKRYDMRGLSGITTHFEDHKHDRWSCAFLLLAALVEAGLVRRPPPLMCKVSVRDLMIILAATVELPAIEYNYAQQRTFSAREDGQRFRPPPVSGARRHSDRHRFA